MASAESVEPPRDDCSARRSNDVIVESIKSAIESIKIVQLSATAGKIQDVPKDELSLKWFWDSHEVFSSDIT